MGRISLRAINYCRLQECTKVNREVARKWVDKWSAWDGLDSMKDLPKHSSHYESSTYKGYYSLYDQVRSLPYNLWSEKWKSRVNSTY